MCSSFVIVTVLNSHHQVTLTIDGAPRTFVAEAGNKIKAQVAAQLDAWRYRTLHDRIGWMPSRAVWPLVSLLLSTVQAGTVLDESKGYVVPHVLQLKAKAAAQTQAKIETIKTKIQEEKSKVPIRFISLSFFFSLVYFLLRFPSSKRFSRNRILTP